jgi:High potential iron-sulfur protein
MTTRRLFIQIVPVSGAVLLAACSDKAPPAAPPAPAAAPAAPPAAAPAPAPAPAAAPAGPTATGPMVDSAADPTAQALGYVNDASKVDKAKYANFVAGSACSNCALYQGQAGAEAGPCPLFAGKQVSAKGWCSSYAKKAA